MTNVARIGDLQGFSRRWRDELESVGSDVHIGDRLLDLWHVTRNAFAAF